jgi:rhomboid family protein
MFPFKDSVARERFPLLTASLIALALVLWLAGALGGGLAQLLLCMLALAVFGQSVEDSIGRVRFAALCTGSWLAGFLLQLPFGERPGAPLLATTVLVAVVLVAYLAIRPHARVLTLVLLPLFAGAVEVPAFALIALWLLAEALLWALGGR